MSAEGSEQTMLVASGDLDACAAAELVAERRSCSVLRVREELQVWELLTADRPRIVLLDLGMLAGAAEICEDVKSEPSLEDTVIVLLAPKGAVDGIQRGMDAGADYFLTLPLNAGDLEDIVSLALIE